MGTSNFMKIHAKNYYVVNGEDFEYEDWNDFKENAIHQIAEYLKVKSIECIPEEPNSYGFDDRYYSSKNIASYSYDWEYYKDCPFRIGIHIYLISGYYTGATLDYDISIEPRRFGDEMCLSQYYGVDDLIEGVIDSCQDYDEDFARYYSKLREIHKRMQEELNKAINKAEEICNFLCDEPYKLEARFNNGETIYSKINQ